MNVSILCKGLKLSIPSGFWSSQGLEKGPFPWLTKNLLLMYKQVSKYVTWDTFPITVARNIIKWTGEIQSMRGDTKFKTKLRLYYIK